MRVSPARRRPPKARPGSGGKPWVIVAAVVGILIGIAALAYGVVALRRPAEPIPVRTRISDATTAQATASLSASDAAASQVVEVPDVVGKALDEARLVLETAGFVVRVRFEGTSDQAPVVGEQQPAPGTVSSEGAVVSIVAPRPAKAATATAPQPATPRPRYVIVIDPGHQRRANSTPEPIGPGSREKKPAVSGGTTGVSTDVPEYEVVLQISTNLRKRLEQRGVKVVMTRTTNDVDLTNIERAAIANKSKADLFVRVHGDGNPDRKMSGISTLYPASNKWTRGFAATSKQAATRIQSALVASTGAVDRGTVARSDLSGFNHAKVPSVLVETGFMSNPVEDRLLSSPHYQDKLAEGMADGIMRYLNESR